MFSCECGREFTRKSGLGYHKRYCGKNNIFYDAEYQCKIGPDGKIVYIHREVLEQKLGRKLKKGEIAHHIDEDKENNDPDNIELKNWSSHAKHHWRQLKPENFAKGENNGQSKLKTWQVIIIKHMIKNKKNDVLIGKIFKVHSDTIRYIRTEKYWKHVKIWG